MAFEEVFSRDTVGSLERARQLHLVRSGSQSQRGIWMILRAHGSSHIIIGHIIYWESGQCIYNLVWNWLVSIGWNTTPIKFLHDTSVV